jgi:hypothetical protein
MSTGAIIARILTQYSDKGSKQAQKDIGKLGKNFDKFAKKATQAFGVAAAASAAFAVKMGVDSVKAALEDQKSQVILANSLRNTVGASDAAIASIEDYISKQQLLVNVSDTALRPSLSALLVATKDLTQAQALQAIALDTSAGTGKDLQTVSIAIAKATTGNVGALKKLGIPLSDNIVKTKDFAGAMKALEDAYGGAAGALAKTDPLTTLKLAFGEIQETLGYALLPTVKEFANYIITTVLPVVQSWIDLNKDKLAKGLKDAAEQAVAFGKAIFGFVSFISRNLTTVKVFATIIGGLFVASKVYTFITAIAALSVAFTGLSISAGAAGVAAALATGGVSAGAAATALGAFALTVGAVSVKALTAGKYVDKASYAFKGMGNISMTTGKQMTGLTKVINSTTVATNNTTGGVVKLTAAQKQLLAIQKELAGMGIKATTETNPIQLEAARLNLLKQENLAILAVDVTYKAFIETQMQANTEAQRYADILNVIKDNKVTSDEIRMLASAWGLTPDEVQAYITKILGIPKATDLGLETPGNTAKDAWEAATAALEAYQSALAKYGTGDAGAQAAADAANAVLGDMADPFDPATAAADAAAAATAAAEAAAAIARATASGAAADLAASGIGSFGTSESMQNDGIGGGSNSGNGQYYNGSSANINITINTLDGAAAGDSVVNAINNSANIRGGYPGIGLSRAVSIL